MAISTFAVGLLPDYHILGVWAPLLLLVLRSLQGFSCGAELVGSIVFVVEHASRPKRGFYGSFADASAYLGILLASLVAWVIHHSFSHAVVVHWAWRLPFLFGLLVALAGWFMRRYIAETQLFNEMMRAPDSYFDFYREYAKRMRFIIMIIGLTLFATVLTYLIYVFSVIYMTSILQYSMHQALSINIVSIIFLVLLEPWMGKLSDYIGRRPLMVFALMGSILWIWSYIWLLQQQSMVLALLAQGVMTIFAAAYFAVQGVTMVEIVPVYLRFSVVTLANAIAVSIFGGMTPFIATLLLKVTPSPYSLALYLSVCALISLFTVYKVHETKPKTIEQSIKEDIKQIARNMLSNGDSIEKVAAVTALPKDVITAIQSQQS